MDSISARWGAGRRGSPSPWRIRLKFWKALDQLGIPCVEAGNPNLQSQGSGILPDGRSGPCSLRHDEACGLWKHPPCATCRPEQDSVCVDAAAGGERGGCRHLRKKSWDFQVTDIIQTTLEENLAHDRGYGPVCAGSRGRDVIFDAEHFFDGYKSNPEYALAALQAASRGGASGTGAVRHQRRRHAR